MFLILFAIIVTSAHNGTRNYPVCKAENFKHPACFEAKKMHEAGEFLKKL